MITTIINHHHSSKMNADRLMQNMMQSMGMGMPFGGGLFDDFMGGHPGAPGHNQTRAHPMGGSNPFAAMMPHGFMNPMSMMMMDPFQSMQQAMSLANNGTNNNGGFSFCSSSVTTYTTDEQGRPQIYQQSNEVKQGPNGLRETKAAVRDSRTGHQELAIGHHLRDKARIKKRSKNAYTGEEEHVEDLVNLDESEADSFEQTWMQQARNASSNNQLGYGGPQGGPTRSNRLALTNGSPSREEHTPYPSTSSRHSLNLANKLFKKDKKKKKTKEDKHK